MRDHDQLALFHRALADFCRMGMPLGQAFRAVARDLEGGSLRAEAEAMAAEVDGGAPLGEAWRRRSGAFPPVYASLVEAGAASGDLPGTLEEIARHAAMRAEADRRVRRVLAYPVLMLVALTGIAWFLFEFVVPQFGVIFSQITDKYGNPLELPALTKLVLGLSASGGILLFLPAVLVVFVLGSWLRRPMEGLGMPLGLGMRLPLVGPLRLQAALSTFSSVLAGLLRRGLPAERALLLAGEASDAPDLRAAAGIAAERVRTGAGLAEAAKGAGLYPPSLLWFVGSAERRGEAAEGVAEVAQILRGRFQGALDRYVLIIAPVFQFLLGLLVALIVMAVFYPILKLQSALM
ncbi:MAG: type II secretion system F family protein [Planctomycetes bacterium]|nr:type II secretion system F family protein [Planctomycetota bacterium]